MLTQGVLQGRVDLPVPSAALNVTMSQKKSISMGVGCLGKTIASAPAPWESKWSIWMEQGISFLHFITDHLPKCRIFKSTGNTGESAI